MHQQIMAVIYESSSSNIFLPAREEKELSKIYAKGAALFIIAQIYNHLWYFYVMSAYCI